MRKGQRVRTSSEPEENQQPCSNDGDSDDRSSTRGSSSDEYSSSDLEAERVMKRSQRFSSSFSFGEDQEPQSKNEDAEEVVSPNNSSAAPPATEPAVGVSTEEDGPVEKKDTLFETNQLPRSGAFRPQELWLAVTRCLSLRWPPCLSINRQSNRKLALQVDLDQSADTQSSVSSELTNVSSSSASPADDRNVAAAKQEKEDVRGRGGKSGPPPRRGISRSSPRLPRARQAADSLLASVILEKEMFLWIELVDTGEERDDLRYRAQWKLSERSKDLAEGVWLSRSYKTMN